MKKTLIIFTLFFYALNFSSSVFAQEITVPVPTSEITPSPIVTSIPVDYELPYPGILPTSPLYTLKLIRDGISDLLISDPVEKSNFYLLQSDKRLAAAIYLFETGDEELGDETLSKGIDYLEKSIEKMIDAKKEEKNVEDIFGKLNTSSEKQKEEIEKIKETKNGKIGEKLSKDYERVLELENKVNTFSP